VSVFYVNFQDIGEEISRKAGLLQKVDQLASRVANDSDELHSGHIKRSMESLYQLRDRVLLHHRRLLDELQSATAADDDDQVTSCRLTPINCGL
jgi:uncharacterized protein YhaN